MGSWKWNPAAAPLAVWYTQTVCALEKCCHISIAAHLNRMGCGEREMDGGKRDLSFFLCATVHAVSIPVCDVYWIVPEVCSSSIGRQRAVRSAYSCALGHKLKIYLYLNRFQCARLPLKFLCKQYWFLRKLSILTLCTTYRFISFSLLTMVKKEFTSAS